MDIYRLTLVGEIEVHDCITTSTSFLEVGPAKLCSISIQLHSAVIAQG